MATIWTDDFESGNALAVSYSYVNHAESNATCGKSGGWGCRSTGTSDQKYSGCFWYTLPTPLTGFTYLRVEMDTDRSSWKAVALASASSLFLLLDESLNSWADVYHGIGGPTDDGADLGWWTQADDPDAAEVSGVVAASAWQRIRAEWWMSTLVEASPGNYEPNADGRLRLSVDGVSVYDNAALKVASFYALTNGTNQLTDVQFGPMGNGDNLLVTTDPLAAETWVDVPNFHEESIDAARYPGGAARCLCDLWTTASGVMIKARLVSLLADGSVDAVVGTSADITAVVPTDATFAVALTGLKRHKLQLTSSTPLTDLWCAPGAKVAP